MTVGRNQNQSQNQGQSRVGGGGGDSNDALLDMLYRSAGAALRSLGRDPRFAARDVEIDDLVQDVYLRVAARAGTFEFPAAFYRTVAHNLAVDRLRACRPTVALDDVAEAVDDGDADPGRGLEADEAGEALDRVVVRLSPAQRAVIDACVANDLELNDSRGISEALARSGRGLSPNAVAATVFRIRAALAPARPKAERLDGR